MRQLPGAFPSALLEDYELLSYSSQRVAIYRRGCLRVYSLRGVEVGLIEADGRIISRVIVNVKQAVWYPPAERILVCSGHALEVLDTQLKTLESISLVHCEDPRLEAKGVAACAWRGLPCLVILWQDGNLTVQCPFLLYPLLSLDPSSLCRDLLLDASKQLGEEEEAPLGRLLASLARRVREGVIAGRPGGRAGVMSPTKLECEEMDFVYEAIWPSQVDGVIIGQCGSRLVLMRLGQPVRMTEAYPVSLNLFRMLHLADTRPVGISLEGGLVLSKGGLLTDEAMIIPVRNPLGLIPSTEWPAALEVALAALTRYQMPPLPSLEVPPFTPLSLPPAAAFPAELNLNSCLGLVESIKELKGLLPSLIKAGEQIRQRSLALEEAIRLHSIWSKQLTLAIGLLSERSKQLLQVHGQVMERERRLLARWQRVANFQSTQLGQIRLQLKPCPLEEKRVLLALLQLQSDALSPQ